ncbi:hypothetical protein EQ832_12085 [Pseudomonas sp. ALS1131]|nr:hypothetical protein [Pseudomonas sp. ALS1131]TRO38585.1 hypothetical protein EQ832_12085 [Pseudomonas sp. ALS1131]
MKPLSQAIHFHISLQPPPYAGEVSIRPFSTAEPVRGHDQADSFGVEGKLAGHATSISLSLGVPLGSTVKDKVTGFEGIATSRTVYLFGSSRIGVESAVGLDGETRHEYIEEDRLQILDSGVGK